MKKWVLFICLIILCGTVCTAQNFTSGDLKTGFLEIGNAKIYYEEKGTGTPFVMIHGGFIDRRMWDDQFEYFSKNYRVIRYDVRNHGSTTSGAEMYTYYDDMNEIFEKLNIDKAIVMGLSMGGIITIDFAITHPEKTIAIIPVSTGISGYVPTDTVWVNFNNNLNIAFQNNDSENAIEYMLKTWTDGPTRSPQQMNKEIREKVKIMLKNTYVNWNSSVKQKRLSPPAIDRLAEIKVPVLTIYGDIDVQGIKELADKITKDIPGAKKSIIKNAAHMVNMEFPNEFNETVEKFLNELKWSVTPDDAEKMINENLGNSDFVILDVRTPEEYATEHFSGAVNIDVKASDFLDKMNTLDKNKTYLVYCKGGGRSANAVDKMKKAGYEKTFNLTGGITRWKSENRKLDFKN